MASRGTNACRASPVPPPSIATAAVLIRGAAAQVLGLKPGSCGGEMQSIWVSEPGCGKITIRLEGATRAVKDLKDEQHKAVLQAIELAANRLVTHDSRISQFEMEKAHAEARYGDVMYDATSQKKDTLRLGYIPGAALVELPQSWSLCPSSSSCGAVCFDYGDESKKTSSFKKKQMMIRFKVQNPDAPGIPSFDGEEAPSEAVAHLNTGEVRLPVPGVDSEADQRGVLPDLDDASTKASTKTSDDEGKAEDNHGGEEDKMVVDPWTVSGKIDYNRLVEEFGTKLFDAQLLERMEKLTVRKGNVPFLHRFLRRGIFFSHRDMDHLLTCVEKGEPFYLYTGRGPSSAAMHLGHLVPFLMTKWLQDAFNVPLVIQMTDDEKFLWKGDYNADDGDNLMYFRHLTTENAKDIIAAGFDYKKTFIFSNLDYIGHLYPNIVRIQKSITYNTARSLFGFEGSNNIGQSAFVAVQAAPSFPSSFQIPLRGNPHMACLIPCAIDQDNYFRATREVAHKLVPKDHPLKGKPCLLHAKFFPPLQGAEGKMSASASNSAIYLTDTPEEIRSKITKHAFSGGQQSATEQRAKGANLDVDVSYQWLRFFLEDDDELEKIGREYGSGQGDYWNTGAVKAKLIDELQTLVAEHQERRARISDEDVNRWMAVRPLEF